MATANTTAESKVPPAGNWFAELASDWFIGEANDGTWLVFRDPMSPFAFIFDKSANNFLGMTEDRSFSRFSVEEGRLMDMNTVTSYEVQ